MEQQLTSSEEIKQLLKRPDDPWDSERYDTRKEEDRILLKRMTPEEILRDPWLVGRLCTFTPRKLAHVLNVSVEEVSNPMTTFGWIDTDEHLPLAFIPNSDFSYHTYHRANMALLSYIWRYLLVRAEWCTCCDMGTMWMQPTNIDDLCEKICHNYETYGTLPNHFFECTVWCRTFMRTNRIYLEPMQSVVRSVDRDHGFWMPNFKDIGEVRRTTQLWEKSGHKEAVTERLVNFDGARVIGGEL